MIKFHKLKLIIYLTVPIILIAAVILYMFLKPRIADQPVLYDKYVEVCESGDTVCHKLNLPYQNQALSVEARVEDLISRMIVAEKIGQMALVERKSVWELNDLAKYGIGGLLSGGGNNPDANTPAGWFEMLKNFQSYSAKARLSIPLLYGVDAVHGHGNVLGATIFPHSIGLGASNDPELVMKVAKATAEEVASTGVNWVYSPNIDVVSDIRWGRTYEAFGSDAALVGELGAAYVEGLQTPLQDGNIVAGAAKHYIGNGAAEWGTSNNKDFIIDQGDSGISEDELRRVHLEPFRRAVDAGVKSVMVGLNRWNGAKISDSRYLVTDVLRNELGFKGIVLSDWYGVYEQEWNKYQALVMAVNAGVDMIMLPFEYQDFSDYMHRALLNGDISQERLDEAVRRILKVKFEIGLFDTVRSGDSNFENFGSGAHRELAREAVRKSLVQIKNDKTLPISKETRKILVAGSAADNIGKQSGGWTVEWQGVDGNWIAGTSILKGIRDVATSNAEILYELNGEFKEQIGLADVGIAVVGESPYAEGWGDRDDLRLSDQDIKTINNLKKYSKKIVVIIVSGRPLDIAEHVDEWDAIIAAWLPGSEGQGVADVLFGDYPLTGKMPVDW